VAGDAGRSLVAEAMAELYQSGSGEGRVLMAGDLLVSEYRR
jgi:hypothetical protein